MKILFVCLGNLCRSPTAEAILNKLIETENLKDQLMCDSAGTSNYHEGQAADSKVKQYAMDKGYTVSSISRPIDVQDFERFDRIITMDNSNYKDVSYLAETAAGDNQSKHTQYKQKIFKMSDYCSEKPCSFIPDPYKKGKESFLHMIDLLEEACQNLLKDIKQKLKQ